MTLFEDQEEDIDVNKGHDKDSSPDTSEKVNLLY